jgi:hypothetical protein
MLTLPSVRPRSGAFGAIVIAAIGLFAIAPPPAAAISKSERAEIEAIVKEYLLKNPEILRDALIELEKRMAAEETKKRAESLKTHQKLLFDSPRGVVVGNRAGDVAVVEFFDYNCGYCKRALTDMVELIKADPKLKFILKEFPVLGPSSVDAARISIAVRMQDSDGKKYLDFHSRLLGTRGERRRRRHGAAGEGPCQRGDQRHPGGERKARRRAGDLRHAELRGRQRVGAGRGRPQDAQKQDRRGPQVRDGDLLSEIVILETASP